MGRKHMYIMRGAPGSGKSTLAKELALSGSNKTLSEDPALEEAYLKRHIFSTDDLFISPTDGVYRFDHTKLSAYHRETQDRCFAAIQDGITPIVVDNTNAQMWQARPYVEMAVAAGYGVSFMEPKSPQWLNRDAEALASLNKHEVDQSKIQRMLDDWDSDEWTVKDVLAAVRERPVYFHAQAYPDSQELLQARMEGKLDAVHEIAQNLRNQTDFSELQIQQATRISANYCSPQTQSLPAGQQAGQQDRKRARSDAQQWRLAPRDE
ncbi:hypothetical protein DFS34DRAFT_593924 [Phlyctochytrium arcticum]|nr:hypothetical protein DFS34DRAFT_593924 [Phlyctochytrium arcticum]